MKKNLSLFVLIHVLMYLLNTGTVSAQWVSSGPEGGYIRCMAQSNSTIFAITGSSSLYSSADNGTSWTFVSGLPSVGDVRDLAVIGNSLFVGTSTGLFRSDDNGLTWIEKTNGFPGGAHWINHLAVSGTTLFAAGTGEGLLRSLDNGENWTVSNTGITDLDITSLAANDNVVFAGGDDIEFGGVFRSTDNGNTWQRVTNGMAYFFEGEWYYGYVAPVNSLGFNGTDLYAGTTESQGIWKSSDNGDNWVFNDPTTRDHQYIHTINGNGTAVFAGTNEGVLRSADNGATWAAANTGISSVVNNYGPIQAFLMQGTDVFAATQGGVFKSSDNGVNWAASSNGIRALTPTYHAFAAIGPDIFFGSGLTGVYRSSDEGTSWMNVFPVNWGFNSLESSGSSLFTYQYVSTDGGNSWGETTCPGSTGNPGYSPRWLEQGSGLYTVSNYGTDIGVYCSLDNGATWTPKNNGIPFPTSQSYFCINSNGATMFLGTSVGAYYSTDNGDNWNAGVFPNFNSWAFYLAKFVSTGTADFYGLYGGGGARGIYRSTDHGANWTQVSDLLVHQFVHSGSIVYASGTNLELVNGVYVEVPRIFSSQDDGQNWTMISGDLNNIATLSLVAEGSNVYISITSAPNYGVFRSSDNGVHWIRISDGLPPSFVSSIYTTANKIFAATNGFSVWQRNLDEFTAPAQPSEIIGSTSPCRGSSQTYSVTNVPGVTYAWQFPTGWVITSGGTTCSVTVTVGNATGLVLVIPSNDFGTGPAQFLFVTQTLTGPSQPSVITGPVNPLEGTSQNYSVVNVAGVSYSWNFPAGWIPTGGDTTNSVTVTVGSGAGNIQVTPSTLCGSGTPRSLAVNPIPTNLTISNIIVSDGQVQCYNAADTIIVSDGESNFLVQSGGQATFIAGQMIKFMPGTKVDSGGYMLGTITITGQYCNLAAAPMVTVKMAEEAAPVAPTHSFFRVYPNPTSGAFTLEINGESETGMTKMEIFSMRGEQVLTSEISGNGKHELSLSGKPVGIYLIRVISGSKTETARIIKQ